MKGAPVPSRQRSGFSRRELALRWMVTHADGLLLVATAVCTVGAVAVGSFLFTEFALFWGFLAICLGVLLSILASRYLSHRSEQIMDYVMGDGKMALVSAVCGDFAKYVFLETFCLFVSIWRFVSAMTALCTLPIFIAGAVVHVVYLFLVVTSVESFPPLQVILSTSAIWVLFGLLTGGAIWAIGRGRRLQEHATVKLARFHRWDGVVHASTLEGPAEQASAFARFMEWLDAWIDGVIFPPLTLVSPEYVRILADAASEDVPAEALICGVCGEAIEGSHVLCERCDSPHHCDCWDYCGACSVYGCGCKNKKRSLERFLGVRAP